ncbi:MAG: UvrB/UvrC motif-containing protein [Phycisphaerales bacterium]|nr:UvrB/UvrC motif-containing protein [Phycisphaerales bacterium]
MTLDLSALLNDWPYEPGQLNVRLIEGDDGKPKVQMRVDLGLLQMEVFGRPDGQQPEGRESLLEFHEMRIDDAMDGLGGANGPQTDQASGDLAGSDAGPMAGGLADHDDEDDEGIPGDAVLTSDDCRQLREEAVQYYHRYISLLVLGDYDGVVRDTTRNMRVIDLCEQYAEEEDDREMLAQFRPFIAMMRTRALASQMLSLDEPAAALVLIDVGINEVRDIYEAADRLEAFEDSHEAQLLRGMRAELAKKLPASQRSELKRRLEEALKAENYELAAILRDELRMLKD